MTISHKKILEIKQSLE